jgi:negative regulator of replication initiation
MRPVAVFRGRIDMDLLSQELREGLVQLLQALTYVTKAENSRGDFYLRGNLAGKVLHIDVEEFKQQGPTPGNSQNPVLPSAPADLHPMQRDEREKALGEFMRSPSFKSERSAVEKFLSLLSFVHRENRGQFAAVERFNGRSRKYFAKSKADLEQSGKSVNPKNIPGSGYWVVTNNSTLAKGVLLLRVMRVLGYDGGFGAFVATHIN